MRKGGEMPQAEPSVQIFFRTFAGVSRISARHVHFNFHFIRTVVGESIEILVSISFLEELFQPLSAKKLS
jgi:hypothetical protein